MYGWQNRVRSQTERETDWWLTWKWCGMSFCFSPNDTEQMMLRLYPKYHCSLPLDISRSKVMITAGKMKVSFSIWILTLSLFPKPAGNKIYAKYNLHTISLSSNTSNNVMQEKRRKERKGWWCFMIRMKTLRVISTTREGEEKERRRREERDSRTKQGLKPLVISAEKKLSVYVSPQGL